MRSSGSQTPAIRWDVVDTFDVKADGYRELYRLRSQGGRYDLVTVRFAEPPIRTSDRWALVRLP